MLVYLAGQVFGTHVSRWIETSQAALCLRCQQIEASGLATAMLAERTDEGQALCLFGGSTENACQSSSLERMQGYDTVLPTQTVSSMCDCFTTPLMELSYSLPQAEHKSHHHCTKKAARQATGQAVGIDQAPSSP